MDLYNIVNNSLVAMDSESFKLEKDIQNLIESNTDEVFGLQFVSSEFAMGDFRLDTLCFDEENSSFVIIEYKKGSSYSVIDQGYSYLSLMLNNKSDFILEYNEKRTVSLKRTDVNWQGSRIIFVSPSFNTYQKNSVNFKDVPFELWEIKKFGGGLVALDNHKPTSKESIQNISPTDSMIGTVSKEVKVYKDEDVLAKTSDTIIELWQELKEKLFTLDNVDFVAQSSYIKLTKNNKGVCYFNFRKDKIKGEIIRGNINSDGSKSKNFFVIDDPKNICREYNFTYKSGVEGHRYLFDINETSDLDYLEMLIRQKYKAL